MPPQPQTGNMAGAGQGGQPGSQNLNQIVLEFLNKKGFNRTERVFRQEASNVDAQGRVRKDRAEDLGAQAYSKAYSLLRQWIEHNLDVYRAELQRLLWPVFVYSYLSVVAEPNEEEAERFFHSFSEPFEKEHSDDLRSLKTVKQPDHLETIPIAKLFRSNEYRLTLTTSVFNTLIQFLETKEKDGGSVILTILTRFMNIVSIDRATAGKDRAFETMIARLHGDDDDLPDEDEGIPGHNPGSANTDKDAPKALPRLFLGPNPRDPDYHTDVRDELEEEDERNPPHPDQLSLVEEYDNQIKQEQSEEEVPPSVRAPLPIPLARQVAMEVQRIKNYRDRFRIPPRNGGANPAVSIVMYTFHNTYDSIICMDFSDDTHMVAVGTSDSYIRVWDLRGETLPSLIPDPPEIGPSSSRKLIGHSGPVYAVSFSASIDNNYKGPNAVPTGPRYLLSCSADKSAILWSLDTWTCLVIYKGHNTAVWDITWGPYGHYFLTGGRDGTARLWSTRFIRPLRIFAGHDRDVDCVAFHPNSAYVFTASRDRTVRMWDLTRGSAVRMFTGHTANLTKISCAPNGKTLASADDSGAIMLWDLASGRKIKRMRGHGRGGIWSLSWSIESSLLVSGGADQTVRTWDVLQETAGVATANKATGEAGGSVKLDGGSASGISGVGKRANQKEVTVTPDQASSYLTKKTPVFTVKFTNMNLIMAGGPYLP